jgi:hypothetical protein
VFWVDNGIAVDLSSRVRSWSVRCEAGKGGIEVAVLEILGVDIVTVEPPPEETPENAE